LRRNGRQQGRRFPPAAALIGSAATLALILSPPAHATFPGSSGLIAFEDFSAGIDTITPQGAERTTLAAGNDPSFSADGRRIAFGRDNLIWIMNSDGSGAAPVSQNEGFQPSFSPDGKRIAFIAARPGDANFELYVMNADGTGETRLTNLPGTVGSPSFSPDGKQIAFEVDGKINVVNVDGTGLTTLAGSGFADFTPDFSPDGKRIAFTVTYGAAEGADIWAMNADGSNAVQLTRHGSDQGLASQQPSYSPDGIAIVFASNAAGPQQLWVMAADGFGQAPLTNPTSSDQDPNWGPATSDATCAGKPATIAGTGGPDRFTGTVSRDVIAGLGGADKIDGLEKGDRICGGGGDDTLRGREGDDRLLGGGGDDRLRAHEGDDKCVGGSGEDVGVACEAERGTE
jgi:dipeptidyl aminopeptidase/acylaminoacyl peptidase